MEGVLASYNYFQWLLSYGFAIEFSEYLRSCFEKEHLFYTKIQQQQKSFS